MKVAYMNKIPMTELQYESITTYIVYLCELLLIPSSLIKLDNNVYQGVDHYAQIDTIKNRVSAKISVSDKFMSMGIQGKKLTLIHELLHFKHKDMTWFIQSVIDSHIKALSTRKANKESAERYEEALVDQLAHVIYNLIDTEMDYLLTGIIVSA